MSENWTYIKGWPGYAVSTYGRIKSLARRVKVHRNGSVFLTTVKEKILKQATDKDGYKYVSLSLDNEHKGCKVHQLVARAFLKNPKRLPMVLHGDDNPANNHLDNLRWGTTVDNTDDKVSRDRQPKGSNHGRTVLTDFDVVMIRRLSEHGFSQRDLARAYSLSRGAIVKILNRTNWKHLE